MDDPVLVEVDDPADDLTGVVADDVFDKRTIKVVEYLVKTATCVCVCVCVVHCNCKQMIGKVTRLSQVQHRFPPAYTLHRL